MWPLASSSMAPAPTPMATSGSGEECFMLNMSGLQMQMQMQDAAMSSILPSTLESLAVQVQVPAQMEPVEQQGEVRVSSMCRVCLASSDGRRWSGLFAHGSRCAQLWVKVMACAWVQVFEGDGLPAQICPECHGRLEVAYRFKQQCEAADARLRRMIADRPARGSAETDRIFHPANLSSEIAASFKCENFDDGDILSDLPTKLFDSVDDRVDSASEGIDDADSKFGVWNFEDRGKGERRTRKSSEIPPSGPGGKDVVESPEPIDGVGIDLSLVDLGADVLNRETEKAIEESAPIVDEEPAPSKESDRLEPEIAESRDDENVTEAREQCELCGKVYKKRSYMLQHLREHSDDKSFQCDRCDRKFSSNYTLSKHSRIHSESKSCICAICGKSFSTFAGLKCHTRAHTGEKPYKCDVCFRRFSQHSNLLIHKRKHSERRDFLCSECNVAFKLFKHLQSHMKCVHSKEKKFSCSICDKKFHRKGGLAEHMAIHSGEKPYKCDTCGHAFASSSNLRAHTRVHSGVKPYVCKICKKSFAQSNCLNRHMQQHPTEKSKCL